MIREGEMGKPYSMDLRERVVAAIEGGMSTRQAARRFAIGAVEQRAMSARPTGQANGFRARCA